MLAIGVVAVLYLPQLVVPMLLLPAAKILLKMKMATMTTIFRFLLHDYLVKLQRILHCFVKEVEAAPTVVHSLGGKLLVLIICIISASIMLQRW